MHPDGDVIGRHGAYYLLNDAEWVKRKVETVTILDQVAYRRRLTVDIELPRSKAAAIATNGDSCLYYVPLTTLRKRSPASQLDLRDEEGKALPLKTREENGRISAVALTTAVEQVLGRKPDWELRDMLEQLAEEHDEVAYVAGAYALFLIPENEPELSRHPTWPRLRRMIEEMTSNQVLWIALRGEPGSRRIVKFAYDVSWTGAGVEAPPRYHVLPGLEPDEIYVIEEPPERRSTVARVLEGAGARLGWRPVRFVLERPSTLDAASYHLQVPSPPGMEPRDILLDPAAEDAEGTLLDPDCIVRPTGAALHVTGPVGYEGRAVVPLRVESSGFLPISLMSATLISALLWGYALRGEAVKEPEVAAAVLLVVPALLTAIAIRPGEHPLSSAVLTGVRLGVLAQGVLASAAAAAIAGVHPSGWTMTEAWNVYARLSLLVVLGVALSYVLALPISHAAMKRARRARAGGLLLSAALLSAASAAILWLLADQLDWVGDETFFAALMAALPAAGALMIAWLSRDLKADQARVALIVWLGVLFVILAAAVVAVAGEPPSAATLADCRDASVSLAVCFAAGAALAWNESP